MDRPELHADTLDRTDDALQPAVRANSEGLWLRLGVPVTLLLLSLSLFILVKYNARPTAADHAALVAMGLHALFALAAAVGPNRVPKSDSIGISLILWLLCLAVIKAYKWILVSRCVGLDVPFLLSCPDMHEQLSRGIDIFFWVIVICILPLVFRAAWLTWDSSVLEEENEAGA